MNGKPGPVSINGETPWERIKRLESRIKTGGFGVRYYLVEGLGRCRSREFWNDGVGAIRIRTKDL